MFVIRERIYAHPVYTEILYILYSTRRIIW